MSSPEEVTNQRVAVCTEAESWIKTPFHHAACVKGAGVDCAHVGATFEKVLGIKLPFPSYYASQWHLHETMTPEGLRFVEIYVDGLHNGGFIDITKEQALPGDVVLSKLGRTFCHGGIIVGWPWVVQAESSPVGAGKVVKANATANWFLSGRTLKFFSYKDWH
jgi:cell wall-associated NlpC family hydrolase